MRIRGRGPTYSRGVPESPLALTRRARRMYRELSVFYPNAHCELDFETPLQLLVATILSAQTTDVGVNKVTPVLFARYPDAAAYAGADRAELEALIMPTGFFRAKADALIKLGADLQERFGGAVPGRMADLVTLPGVGRKTATWCWETPSGCRGSPWTPTSADCPAGSDGPMRRTRSRSSARSATSSRIATGPNCRTS